MRPAAGGVRRVGVAVVTALVAAGAVVTGAGTAVAVDPPPNRIAVASLPDGSRFDLLTPDAVYVHQIVEGASDDIYRLPLTTDGTGTTIGAPVPVASAAPSTRYAEHEGTIAYVRPGDGALVLRAPDGAETAPTWADPADFSAGVEALTTSWVVGTRDWHPVVFNIATGAELDLLGMSQVPEGAQWPAVGDVSITDDRVAWTAAVSVFPPGYKELLTVGLDADGPTGAVTSVGRVLRDTLDWSDPFTEPALVGDVLFWQALSPRPAVGLQTSTLRWRSAPYDAAPGVMALPTGPMASVSYAGENLVLNSAWSRSDDYGTPMFSASWRPVSAPTSALWSTGEVTGHFEGAAGSLYVYSTTETQPTYWLSDVSGRPVRASGWVPPIAFTDVWPGETFTPEIMWLARQGLTTGYTDGSFRRQATVNRDAMAAFLYRLTHDGADAPDCTAPAFVDVPAAHPFCGEIAWLADTKITTGWPDGTFRPGQPVTREAMAAFLLRLHLVSNPGAPVPACSAPPFTDVSAGHPFCGAIRWLAETGVSTGWADHTFRPAAFVERQAMAAFLYRFVDGGLLDGKK